MDASSKVSGRVAALSSPLLSPHHISAAFIYSVSFVSRDINWNKNADLAKYLSE